MLEKNAKYLIYSGCIDCGFKKFETIDKKNWVIYWKLKLSIKQCFRLVWNVEKKKKKKKVKAQGLQRQIMENQYFSENVQFVIMKTPNLSNNRTRS